MQAVILAGGRGTRLEPYTTVLPKPLMPLGDMPVLELLIRQLARAGVRDITIAVGHLASLIEAYFGNGERLGVGITYSHEREPLGTAGPLGLIRGVSAPFLVVNGDLLTDLDFAALANAHRSAAGAATIGLYSREIRIELGVIETAADNSVVRYIEKPTHRYRASMGAYVFEPWALDHVPRGTRFDLPDLVRALIASGERVHGYEHHGYWLDIGQRADYEQAQKDFAEMRERLLGGVAPSTADR